MVAAALIFIVSSEFYKFSKRHWFPKKFFLDSIAVADEDVINAALKLDEVQVNSV